MNKALLDTDILSEIIKGDDRTVASHATQYRRAFGLYTLSSISVFSGGSATLSGAITAATGAIVDFFNGLKASVNAGASFNGPGLYVLQSAFGRPTDRKSVV